MPRGRKSKAGAQGKRHQSQDETESLRGGHVTAAAAAAAATAEEVSPSTPVSGGSPPSTPAPGPFLTPQGASAAYSPEAVVSCPRTDEGAQSLGEESTSTSCKGPPTLTIPRDHLTRLASVLVQFLLEKIKKNERISWAQMIKGVKKKDKEQFPEGLSRASEHTEVGLGLQLKEVNPSNHCYAPINLLDLPSEGSLSKDWSVPKQGLLMNILGMILKCNHATEKEIWEILNVLQFCAGRKHAMFGEPRKLMTKEFMQQNFLEYRQVPASDPPRYESLWGPRAHAETTKMKVLQIMARLNETVQSAFPTGYEEALRDEEERAAATAASIAKASAPSKAKSQLFSHLVSCAAGLSPWSLK